MSSYSGATDDIHANINGIIDDDILIFDHIKFKENFGKL